MEDPSQLHIAVVDVDASAAAAICTLLDPSRHRVELFSKPSALVRAVARTTLAGIATAALEAFLRSLEGDNLEQLTEDAFGQVISDRRSARAEGGEVAPPP